MSLLLGTLKNKLGILRQFKEMSLDELDFTSKEDDYMLEDLDDDDFGIGGAFLPENAKKRLHDGDKMGNLEETVETVKKGKLEESLTGIDPAKPDESQTRHVPIKIEVTQGCSSRKVEAPSSSSKDITTKLEEKQMELKLEPESISDIEMKVAGVNEFSDSDTDPEWVPLTSRSVPQRHVEPSLVRAFGIKDDIVTVDELIARLEDIYLVSRDLVVRGDGFISTPLHALKQLALKFNEKVHVEVNNIPMGKRSRPLARVELLVGIFRGVGEAFHRRMAAQMAAIDLLMRVEKLDFGCHIVPFALFPGWRIRPAVTTDLMLVCKTNGLKPPRYITKSNILEPEKPVCLVECHIGDELIAYGESDLSYVARKLSAYNAIEAITGDNYPLEYVALGTGCLSYRDILKSGKTLTLSDTKKQWLLDDSAKDFNNEDRGIDTEELDALKRTISQEELDEMAEKKRDVTVTVKNHFEDSQERKVELKESI